MNLIQIILTSANEAEALNNRCDYLLIFDAIDKVFKVNMSYECAVALARANDIKIETTY